MDKCHLDEVNFETCWPAVYLVGRPTHSQGSLVAHVLARPALLTSPINVDPSNLIGRFALPCPAGFASSQTSAYNRGQNCWDDQPLPPLPQFNVEISSFRSGEATHLCTGGGGRHYIILLYE